MTDDRGVVADTMRAVLGEVRGRLEVAADYYWSDDVWARVREAGLLESLLDEDSGGAGLAFADAIEAVRVCGEHAEHLPIPETMFANHALSRARLRAVDGPASIAGANAVLRLDHQGDRWRIAGRLTRVPWGRRLQAVAADARDEGGQPYVVRVSPSSWNIVKLGKNLAGAPRDDLAIDGYIDGADVAATDDLCSAAAGAAARTIQIAGALQSVLEMTIEHVSMRKQFGRPLAAFQAVQHQLARLAGDAFIAETAAAMLAELPSSRRPLLLAAAAKTRASEAAGDAVSIAHQLHGAIGLCEEHSLPRLSASLQSWRDEFGAEAELARRLGRAALSSPDLWAFITAV